MKVRILVVSLLLLGALVFAQRDEEARQARQELESTDRLLERAEPIIRESDNPEAVRLFDAAGELQRQAWGLFNRGQYRPARQQTRKARLLIQRALELIEADPDKVSEELRRTAEFIAEAEPAIRRSGLREAERLLDLALSEQETARRSLAARRYALALRFTRAARQHTREALGMVRRRGGRALVEQELERTGQLLERVQERAGKDLPDRAREVLVRAQALQQEARAVFEAGRFPQGLRLTLAARNLLLRAWEAARGAEDPELVAAAMAENDRLIAEWQEPVERDGDEPTRQMFQRALELQVRVRARLAAREYGAAWRESQQVRRILNRVIENLGSEPPADEPD